MSLILSADQESIRDLARKLVRDRAPIGMLRDLRDRADPVGFSRDLWLEMASLGFLGIAIPEAYGGAGLGYAELGLVLEELGRHLVPTPLLSTVILGAEILLRGGSEAQKQEHLPAIVAGDRVLALALDEGTRHAPTRVAVTAERAGDGFRISGEKVMVLDGHVADALLVVARTSGNPGDREGLTVFLLPSRAPGITVTRTSMIDSRNAARVRFDAAPATAADVIGAVGQGADVIDPALDRGRVGISAEMLGGIAEAFEQTVAYLKVRRQFGVPIGSFQALKHRAAQMFCELELTRSVVMDALRAVDAGRADAPILASAAKARASDVFLHIAGEAIQMHGGVGVTDELDIGFFLKRARAAEVTLGGAATHRARFADLSGY